MASNDWSDWAVMESKVREFVEAIEMDDRVEICVMAVCQLIEDEVLLFDDGPAEDATRLRWKNTGELVVNE